jgi:2-aminoadipate transaminase
MMDHSRFLSGAARAFEESAIRRIGAIGARVPDLISFAPGYPAASTFPWDDLRAIATELLEKRDGNVLQYGGTRGYRPLIEHVVKDLDARGVRTNVEQVIITTGSQQGLDLAGRVLLDPGDVVLVELPTYSGAIAAFRNLGATLVGVEQDDEGIAIQAIHDELHEARSEGKRVRFIYVTPNFHNPTGALMSLRRRLELLEAAREHDLLIVEDDPYGSLYFEDRASAADTRPLAADDRDGRVIYLGSFSKTLAPGFRVAWLIAPEAIASSVELAKQATDLCTGALDQRIVQQALARGVVNTMAPTLRALYQQKCVVMEQALREKLGERATWTAPRGGFFLWADFGADVDDMQLFEHAIANRVSFVVGSAFHVNGEGHRFARLSFSAPSPEQIAEGIARLARAVDETLVSRRPSLQAER